MNTYRLAARRVRCVAGGQGTRKGREKVTKIIVDVMLKREIHDPQGEAISRASQRLGYGDVVGVRQGKRFEVELRGEADDSALTRVGELAGELLANPVIEEFVLRAE
jgi:phosphoribosylformylglycinamidine synthase subunit PurS